MIEIQHVGEEVSKKLKLHKQAPEVIQETITMFQCAKCKKKFQRESVLDKHIKYCEEDESMVDKEEAMSETGYEIDLYEDYEALETSEEEE